MKSFFQRHSESRPGPSKPPSKSRHKLWASVDSVQVTPPIATAPPEKQRNSEDRPYAPSRPNAQNGIAPGVPASAIHGHARSQPTQPQDVPARATQPVNGSPDDRDARGRRSAKPPTPLSSSEHVSGIDEPKTARPSRQRGGQELGPPATAPAPEIWIPPSTTTQPTNHAPSRPSQDRERMQPHREEGRRDRENGEREKERERDRAREREKERKREKENKRDEDYRARDVIGAEKDYTRSRDPERHRERERRREYPSSGTKDRDRARDRAGESGRGREGDRTRERYEYERAERERIRVEEERYARTREQAERDKIKAASKTEPHQSRSRSKSRHPTREFLEEGDSSDSSRRKPPVSYRHRTRGSEDVPSSSRKVREPPSLIPAAAVGSTSASQQQPVYPNHALSSSMKVHLPADPRSRSGRLDAGADNVPASGSENERERTRKSSRPYNATSNYDTRPGHGEYRSNTGWHSDEQRERSHRPDDRYREPRTTESSSHRPPEMPGDRTRKGSNASQTARYSPQTLNKVDGSPGTHGDVLKPEHTSSRPNYPPQATAKAPSRTPSMVKLSESSGGMLPVGRVPSHTSDPSRSHPPSPAENPASSGPLPVSHTESSKPEAAKGSHSPSYQVWHPPTPITQHSTPQGGLQPLNGAGEGQKLPSATRLAPSSSLAIVPNVATESPGNNGQYGQFLHPSSAAMRPRTISTDSTRNKPKDIPPPSISKSPKDSPIQSKESSISGTKPSPAEAGNSRDSPQQPLPILLRVQIKPDSSPETIVQSSSVDKKGSSTESVHISAALPHTSTSNSRNTPAAPSQPSSHAVPSAHPSSRPNGTRTVTFAQPHETTSSQRPKDAPTYPMSAQRSSGREGQISEFGERQATVHDNTIVNRTYTQPPTAEAKPAPPSHSQQAAPTTARYRTSMHPVAASQHPPTAPSFTLPPADAGYDSTYRRHRHEHRPTPAMQSRYTSATTHRNPAPPLAPPPTAPPAIDHRSLLSDPTVPYGAPRPADRSTSREDFPHPTAEAPPKDSRSAQPADSRQGHSTPVARIQNQRLAELLSSPVPASTDKIISISTPHGYVQPTLAPETRQEATRRAPYPQEPRLAREDHISHTVPVQSDYLRRRTSAQRLPSTNPPPALPVPAVGGSAPQQPIPGDSAHPSSHRNALAYPSKFQSQWSTSSAMATDGSQNTMSKSRASPPQRDPSNLQGNADPRAAPSQKPAPPSSSTTAYPQVSSASRYANTKPRDAYVENTAGSQQPRYADGFNGPQKANIVAASHAGEIINPALQQYTSNASAAPSGSVPTQPSRSHRAVEQPGYPTAYTDNNGASHHRSRSSVIYNNVPPKLVRPQHYHSSSMPAPVQPDDHAIVPPMVRAYNSYPHPTTQPTSTSQVPTSQSTQHATTQQTALPSGANPDTHTNGNGTTNGTARPLARKPSEESVLQTPSSLAQSVPVSRSNSQASQQERTRKTSLLGMFRRGPKASQQQVNEPANATVPPEALPPTDHERSRVPPSQPIQPPPPKPFAYDRPHPTKPPPAVPKVRITPQPGHSNKPHGHAPPPKLFNPFSYLTSKRYRTVSAASLEAVDGTATNTVVASPTVSMHSQAPPPPPQRDVYVATQMWAQSDYRGRPGVVFDVAEESRIDSAPKKPLARRGTGRRPSREERVQERAQEYPTQTAQAES